MGLTRAKKGGWQNIGQHFGFPWYELVFNPQFEALRLLLEIV
jgi:hypothetical protein